MKFKSIKIDNLDEGFLLEVDPEDAPFGSMYYPPPRTKRFACKTFKDVLDKIKEYNEMRDPPTTLPYSVEKG